MVKNTTEPTPKRRERIVKKDTDHVYSATQDQGERYDTVSEERQHKRAAVALAKDEKTAAIHALESEVLIPPKKNRGRPSKAYLEAQRAYEEALARRQAEIEEARNALNSNSQDGDDDKQKFAAEEMATTAPAEQNAQQEAQPKAEEAAADSAPAQQPTTPAQPDAEDDDDVPEFIKMQRAAITAEPTLFDTVDTPDKPCHEAVETLLQNITTSPETPTANAALTANAAPTAETTTTAEAAMRDTETTAAGTTTVAEETPTAASGSTTSEEKSAAASDRTALLRRLSEAYADGQRFIIDQDVPVIETDDDYGTIAPATEPESIGFRRFKDDTLVNPLPTAIDAAVSLIQQVRTAQQGEDPLTPKADKFAAERPAAERLTAEKPAPQRLGEVTIEAEGVIEIDNQHVGYLRSSDYNYMPSPDDVFVSQHQIRSYSLKTGDLIHGIVKAPREGEKYYTLKEIISINGCAPHQVRDRIAFEHLTPLFPDEQYRLTRRGEKSPLSCRIVDLFAPIGKGQRALIVAQPKTGKTILMKQIANAIAAHYPETYLIMLLIDERPEEVTDMARTVNAEVIASTFDEPAKRHVRIASIVLEKAKRMVECGKDVVIFLDSITRLARAFNTEAPTSGKILSGGVEANALQKPKRFFGAARNIEGQGSLTIIATALIDTGSKMDEVIFEEFKGTGNMELQLDRTLANKRIFPAVNLVQSSTRREDLLLDEMTVNRMFITRNYMADMSPVEAMNFLRKRLESTISNEEFVTSIGN